MNILDFVKKAAPAAIAALVPGAAPVIAAVNALLPKERQLDLQTATMGQVQEAVDTLPAESRVKLAEIDVQAEIASINADRDIFAAAMDADKSGNTTRPAIALMFAWFYVIGSSPVLAGIAYAIFASNDPGTVADKAWPLVSAVLTPPVTFLLHYVGKRTREKVERYRTASGANDGGVAGVLGGLFGGKS